MNTKSVEFNPSLIRLSDPRKSYLSSANKNILKNLTSDLKKGKKLFLVTGERNCGKTTLVQRAVSELETKTLLVDIGPEKLDYEQLIDFTGNKLKEGFSSETSFLKIKLVHLKQLLNTESIKHVVFLTNQSLEFQPSVLEDILKLVNSNLFSSCILHLIVTGLPELETKLKESNLSVSVISGINLFQIEPLSGNDIRSYINFNLKDLKKQSEDLFSDAAIEHISFYSKGLPGLINRLCNLGLLTASNEEKPIVTEDMMDEVLDISLLLDNEVEGTSPKSTAHAPLPFRPSFNQPATIASSPEQDQKLSVNKLLKPDQGKNTVHKDKIKQDFVKQVESPEQLQQSSAVNRVRNNKVTIEISTKSIFISAFFMGVIFSALIGAGWYFLELQNQKFSTTISKITGSIQQKIESKFPQFFFHEDQISEKKVNNTSTKLTSDDEIEASVIQVLLQQAEQQIADKKMMIPVEDNAWLTYNKILELNPGNQQALSGINKIKETYTRWARKEIENRDTARALYFLNKALEISPDDPDVLDALLIVKYTSSTMKKEDIPELGNTFYKLLDEPGGIAKLLTIAEQQIIRKNLTKPENDNAYSTYQLILGRFPENKQAIRGIEKIKDTYISWAKNEIRQEHFTHAEYLYGKALEIAPSDPEVLSALEKLRKTNGNL